MNVDRRWSVGALSGCPVQGRRATLSAHRNRKNGPNEDVAVADGKGGVREDTFICKAHRSEHEEQERMGTHGVVVGTREERQRSIGRQALHLKEDRVILPESGWYR